MIQTRRNNKVKNLLVLILCAISIAMIIWGIVSYAEIVIHSDDALLGGAHHQLDNSNMWYWLIHLA